MYYRLVIFYRKKSYLLLLAILNLCATTVNAQPTNPKFEDSNRYIIGLNTGSSWSYPGKTQTFYSTPETERTYAAITAKNTLVNAELFLGIQKALTTFLQIQLGLAIAKTEKATLSGNIWDDADPEFNNYSYIYTVRHLYLGVKGKILGNPYLRVKPYVSSSFGFGFNQASNFNNAPLECGVVAVPNFRGNTLAQFSYTLGAGLQYDLSKNWQIGLGYEFSDWGKSQLARAPQQTLGNGLTLHHLYTNGLSFNLTYLA
ncbi:outer membrane protein [Legionella dresdenensis]|uniref:Outer membrane protein n=1 Tax=Legionella dresdenensis TaxID=450200 RepID=A0ABV8CEA1_9GAMM